MEEDFIKFYYYLEEFEGPVLIFLLGFLDPESGLSLLTFHKNMSPLYNRIVC